MSKIRQIIKEKTLQDGSENALQLNQRKWSKYIKSAYTRIKTTSQLKLYYIHKKNMLQL